jgi:hypothetical protein
MDGRTSRPFITVLVVTQAAMRMTAATTAQAFFVLSSGRLSRCVAPFIR